MNFSVQRRSFYKSSACPSDEEYNLGLFDLACFALRRFWVVKSVQKEPKDKDSELRSSVFWAFLNDLNDPNDLV